MISKIYSIIPVGYEGQPITIEGDKSEGLPTFNIVGLASKTVSEARERVRSALKSSGFSFPAQRITINLAPAELAKDGPHLDLPIALSVLILSGQLSQKDTSDAIFVGELSLEGNLRPVRGIINTVEAAKKQGFKTAYIPYQNLPSADLVKGITLIGVKSLSELFAHLKGQTLINTAETITPKIPIDAPKITLDDIEGQPLAKRTLEIAIAGHHNLLLIGPPGTGKTMLATASSSLLPDLTPDERIAVTKIHELSTPESIITTPPFRAPHHTASSVSVIGGGKYVAPGEISLAHLGVLFLDELPEFPKNVLEALRQPLENREITISRASTKTTYPADFMLIAAMNPCPCGYLGDDKHPCNCSDNQIQHYLKKISGPLLDRIDLCSTVGRISTKTFLDQKSSRNEQIAAKDRLKTALSHQKLRGTRNSSLTLRQLSAECHISQNAQDVLNLAAEKLALSARSYLKTLRVARTIADLEDSPAVLESHISEAISLRPKLPGS